MKIFEDDLIQSYLKIVIWIYDVFINDYEIFERVVISALINISPSNIFPTSQSPENFTQTIILLLDAASIIWVNAVCRIIFFVDFLGIEIVFQNLCDGGTFQSTGNQVNRTGHLIHTCGTR